MKNKGVKQSQSGIVKKNKVASTSTLKPVLPTSPPWLELPEDITAKILHKLGPIGLLVSAQKVCTQWRKICRDPSTWRVIDMWKLGDADHIYELPYDGIGALCRLAVDLSQGQVTEINIEDFGSNNLLEFIAERCGHLKCLRLAFCDRVTGKTLSRAVKGFPMLEELQLVCTPTVKNVFESIGQSCPMLKTFVLNRPHGSYVGRALKRRADATDIRDALAIATFMPELRHLQLIRSRITNDALEAILNGCPKLKSLDLRNCFNLNLEGELGKRCDQQIGIFLRPHDPTDDYEWDDVEFVSVHHLDYAYVPYE